MIERQLETLGARRAAGARGGQRRGRPVLDRGGGRGAADATPRRSTTAARGWRGRGTSSTRPASRSGPTEPSAVATASSTRSIATSSTTAWREARRVRLHRRIAERKVAAFGARAGEIAGELAAHFEAARDTRAGRVVPRARGRQRRGAPRRSRGDRALHEGAPAAREPAGDAGAPGARAGAAGEARHAAHVDARVCGAGGRAGLRARARAVAPGGRRAASRFRCCAAWSRSTRCARQHRAARVVGEELLALCERTRRPGGAGAGALRARRHAVRSGRARRARSSTSSARSRSTIPRPTRSTCRCTAATIPASPAGAGSAGCSGCAAFPTRPCEASRRGSRWPNASGIRSRSTSRTSSAAMVRLFRWEIRGRPGSSRARDRPSRTTEGFAYQRAVGALLEGLGARCMQGRPDDAIARLRESLAGYEATGAAAGAAERPSRCSPTPPAMAGRMDEGLGHVAAGDRRRGADGPALPPGPAEPRPAATCCCWGGGRGDRTPRRRLLPPRARPGARVRRADARAARGDQPGAAVVAAGTAVDAAALLAPLVGAFSEGLDLRDLRIARALLAQ